MSKIVFTSLDGANRSKTRIKTKRVKGADGKIVAISVLNGDGASFAADLTHVFRKNVRKARRANKSFRRTPNAATAKT
ncbi:MAG: hypothetical protein ABSC92_05690 [Rhizomicrobium sp.]|jgi:hypothetical protein